MSIEYTVPGTPLSPELPQLNILSPELPETLKEPVFARRSMGRTTFPLLWFAVKNEVPLGKEIKVYHSHSQEKRNGQGMKNMITDFERKDFVSRIEQRPVVELFSGIFGK